MSPVAARDAGAERRALAAVHARAARSWSIAAAQLALQTLARAVGRAVVDDDDLLVGGRGADPLEDARRWSRASL